MRRYLKVLAGLASVLVVFGVVVVLKNRDTRWDAGQAIVSPGSVTEPRVGVIIVALSQPSQYAPRFWNNISKKILDTVIPWPINIIAGRDKGVVLVDPVSETVLS